MKPNLLIGEVNLQNYEPMSDPLKHCHSIKIDPHRF